MQAENQAPERGRGCLARALRLAGGGLLLLLALAACGAIYEGRAQRAVAERFPPPGRLVQVDGRAMHIDCRGESGTTVILDAGQGGWSSDWTPLLADPPAGVRLCAYDRAGYGWSEPAADARTPAAAAADLEALLEGADLSPPFVLVAYSHAGLAARLFAARNAEQLAGLVLVDPATEFDIELLGPERMQQQRGAVGIFQMFSALARLGVIRLIGTANMAGSAPFIAAAHPAPELYYPFIAAPQWWETSLKEFVVRLDAAQLDQVREEGEIPPLPLVVIAAGEPIGPGEELAALERARHERLRALAARSPLGEFLVAEGSSHEELPRRVDLLYRAIELVLDPVR